MLNLFFAFDGVFGNAFEGEQFVGFFVFHEFYFTKRAMSKVFNILKVFKLELFLWSARVLGRVATTILANWTMVRFGSRTTCHDLVELIHT